VISKVERDNLMIELESDLPGYGLAGHKGYAAASHMQAVRDLGPTVQHRHTWLGKILGDGQLPGMSE
jgi:ribonuclease HII